MRWLAGSTSIDIGSTVRLTISNAIRPLVDARTACPVTWHDPVAIDRTSRSASRAPVIAGDPRPAVAFDSPGADRTAIRRASPRNDPDPICDRIMTPNPARFTVDRTSPLPHEPRIPSRPVPPRDTATRAREPTRRSSLRLRRFGGFGASVISGTPIESVTDLPRPSRRDFVQSVIDLRDVDQLLHIDAVPSEPSNRLMRTYDQNSGRLAEPFAHRALGHS